MLKRFISYYKPYRLLFALDMAAAVLIAACNLVYPSVVKNIINNSILLQNASNADYVLRFVQTIIQAGHFLAQLSPMKAI